MVFPVVVFECESWTVKKAKHWRIDAFELWCWRRLLRVCWAARRSNQSILKEISPEYSLERTDAKALVLCPSGAKSWFTGKDPDAAKDGRQEEKGALENEMVGWYHQLNGHEFEQTWEKGEGQGDLLGCSPWGHKESDMTEWLNNSKGPPHKQRMVTSGWVWDSWNTALLPHHQPIRRNSPHGRR